ncbi:MAG: Sua5/YciO/YrdC/YwlC family protein [Desulfobacterales bacterium]|nr:Sua5/YciO/YrdC/YwlC family protein [Desulfobacterales bacterium]
MCFPTRCLYGLAADAFNAAAVERVFEIKQRPAGNAAARPDQPDRAVGRAGRARPAGGPLSHAAVLARAADPGAGRAGRASRRGSRPAPARSGSAWRHNPVARALAEAVAQPITGTSANLSGGSGCRQIGELDPRIARQVDLILDGGAAEGRRGVHGGGCDRRGPGGDPGRGGFEA